VFDRLTTRYDMKAPDDTDLENAIHAILRLDAVNHYTQRHYSYRQRNKSRTLNPDCPSPQRHLQQVRKFVSSHYEPHTPIFHAEQEGALQA
jgi:hypothetical protein